MKIRFDAARFEPFSWQESIAFAPEELAELGLSALGPVECRGSLTYSAPSFLLRGALRYEQTVVCDRCLKPVELAVQGDLDLMLIERPRLRGGTGGGEAELQESDLGVVEVAGDGFETRPLVLEQVALGVPMKPLCRENCRGLCPVCGIDRNVESCDCAALAPDPRWAALASLKGSLPGGKSSGN